MIFKPSLYPSLSSSHDDGSHHHHHHSSLVPVTEYFRRIINTSQMDLEFAFWQMSRLLVCPTKVYQSTKTRNHIKKQWARDDPAFVVILLVIMVASNMVHTLFFGDRSFTNFLIVIFETIFFDFLLITLILSSLLWFLTNKYFSRRNNYNRLHNLDDHGGGTDSGFAASNGGGGGGSNRSNSVAGDGSSVEWLYAFDVHCNSYFIYFVISNLVMIFLTPIFWTQNTFSLILGNSVYFIALIGYFYITFLGYEALPMIEKSERLLYPLSLFFIVYILSMLTHWSIRSSLLHYHYGYHWT